MNYSADNLSLWNFVIQFGLISILLVFSTTLKKNIPFFRNSMMPTAVLAGFILLLLRNLNIVRVDAEFLENITYHGIAIGFIAMALRAKKGNGGSSSAKEGFQSGALIVSTYLLQALVGIACTVVLSVTVMKDLFPAAGVLLPMGYGQGPGQANNIGATYEAAGFTGGRSFGLALAAAGYLCACVVGVIYMNILVKQGKAKRSYGDGSRAQESLALEEFYDKNDIPLSESIDIFTIQCALIFICYLLTYLICKGLSSLVPGFSSLLWGFNFIFGSLVASVVLKALEFLRKKNVIQKQYQNNYLLSRISGLAFDAMIVGGIASIEIKDLEGLWLPFLLLAVLGGVSTLIYLRILCRRLYPTYANEAFFGMYGMLTGTISSGVLLVREIDPNLHTPAAMNLVTGSSFGIAFGFPVLLLVGIAPARLGFVALMTALYFIVLLVLLYKFKGFKKERK